MTLSVKKKIVDLFDIDFIMKSTKIKQKRFRLVRIYFKSIHFGLKSWIKNQSKSILNQNKPIVFVFIFSCFRRVKTS